MFAKKSLPVGTLFIILAIALAFLGVGYALWSETLSITGTVQTGEVDVRFSSHPVEECVDVNGDLICPEPEGKAYAANCSVQWVGPDGDTDGDNGPDQLVITVNGMYPSWHCLVTFDVTNIGNVPVHVKHPKPTSDIPEWVAFDWAQCYEDGVQLHQGSDTTGLCTIDIHFTNEQAPPENSGPHTFGFEILAHQWNEEPPDVITVESAMMNFGPTGWAGWSCPTDHPYVVGGNTDCILALSNSLAWEPGASVAGFNYPITPFGYVYTPPEEGWIVQNGGTSQSCKIYVDCSTAP